MSRNMEPSELPLPASFSDADLKSFLEWIQVEILTLDSSWDPSCAENDHSEALVNEHCAFPSVPVGSNPVSGLENLGSGQLQPAIHDHSDSEHLNTPRAPKSPEGRFRATAVPVAAKEDTFRASVNDLPPHDQLPIISTSPPTSSQPAVHSPSAETARFSHTTIETRILTTIMTHAMKEWNQTGTGHSKAPWSKTAIITHRLYPKIVLSYLRLLLQDIDADPRDKAKLRVRVNKFERLKSAAGNKSSHSERDRRCGQLGIASLEAFDRFMVGHLELVTWLETGAEMARKTMLEASKPGLLFVEPTSERRKQIHEPQMDKVCGRESERDGKGKRPITAEGPYEGFTWWFSEYDDAHKGECSQFHAGETSYEVFRVDPLQDTAELKRMLRKQLGENPLQKLAELRRTFRKGPSKKRLGSETIKPLLNWLTGNEDWPYPTEKDKEQLMIATKLSEKQVSSWFINYRRRHWRRPESETMKDEDEGHEVKGGCSEDSWGESDDE